VAYSDTLIDHFRNPRNAGMMREPDGVGEGEYGQCMDLARQAAARDAMAGRDLH
jgi:NifU-like protein involved in Fe-S cluster formation